MSTQRRIVTAATLTVLTLLLVVMAVVGFRALTAPIDRGDTDATESACPEGQERQTKRFVRRGEVQVSVYNAGAATGEAQKTMAALERAGFRPGEVGNAPEDVRINRARVFTTTAADPEARLVARFMGKGVGIEESDEEYGPGVDVFIGRDQGPFDETAKRVIELAEPVVTCAPVG